LKYNRKERKDLLCHSRFRGDDRIVLTFIVVTLLIKLAFTIKPHYIYAHKMTDSHLVFKSTTTWFTYMGISFGNRGTKRKRKRTKKK